MENNKRVTIFFALLFGLLFGILMTAAIWMKDWSTALLLLGIFGAVLAILLLISLFNVAFFAPLFTLLGAQRFPRFWAGGYDNTIRALKAERDAEISRLTARLRNSTSPGEQEELRAEIERNRLHYEEKLKAAQHNLYSHNN